MQIDYKPSNQGWGLTGSLEGQKLFFTGTFDAGRIKREQWQSFWNFFRADKSTAVATEAELDIYSLFSNNAKRAWRRAFFSAQKRQSEVGIEDLFLALLKSPTVNNLFARFKISRQTAETFLLNYLKLKSSSNGDIIKKIPFAAFQQAVKLNNHKIGSLMLLGALLTTAPEENILQAIFANIGLTLEKLEIFSAWILKLRYQFPDNSPAAQLLFCCQQAENLENHFGYFYQWPAIETAVDLSSGQTFKDLEHKKALQLLVKAGALAQSRNEKIISEALVLRAAQS